MAFKGFKDTDPIENIVEKGKTANFEQFHLFPQCFPKGFSFNVLKLVYMEGKIKLGLVAFYQREVYTTTAGYQQSIFDSYAPFFSIEFSIKTVLPKLRVGTHVICPCEL